MVVVEWQDLLKDHAIFQTLSPDQGSVHVKTAFIRKEWLFVLFPKEIRALHLASLRQHLLDPSRSLADLQKYQVSLYKNSYYLILTCLVGQV